MRIRALIGWGLLLTVAPSAVAGWVTGTAAEFATQGDFDGDERDDLLVVDRASGIVRVGIRQPDGSVRFEDPLSSGVPDVTSIAFGDFGDLGNFGGDRRGVAITNPDFNAVNIVAPGQLNSTFPINAIGPRLLIALDGGPSLSAGDLVTVTSRNDLPDAEQLESWVAQLPTPVGVRLDRPNQSAPGGQFAFMARGSGAGGGDELWLHASPFDLAPVKIAVPSGSDWISFGTHDPGVTVLTVLVYGLTDLSLTPRSDGALGAKLTTSLPAAPALAVPLEPTSTAGRFLVIYEGGAGAQIFAFDGALPLVAIQSIAAPPGEKWSNVVALGNGFALFCGPSPGGRSATAHVFGLEPQGTYLPRGAPTALPPFPANRSGNVFALDAELFVARDPQFLAALRAGDWSSNPSGLPAAIDVTGEEFAGGTIGIHAPKSISLPAPSGSAFALTNQLAPDLSVSSVGGARGLLGPSLRFAPAPGRFAPRDAALLDDVLPVTIEASGGVPVWYRAGAGEAWRPYQGPIPLRSDTTLEAYADQGGGARSPILRGEYLFGDGPLPPLGDPDLNGNGLGDAWEKAFAVSDPRADDDSDGADNRSEHDNGTDPRDPLSTPELTLPQLRLVVTGFDRTARRAHLRVYGPSGTAFRIEWSPTLRAPWTALSGSDFTIPAAGQLDFDDPSATAPERYYRIATSSASPSVAAQLRILGVLPAQARVLLRLDAAPGTVHRVDRSPNLQDWSPLPAGSVLIPAAGYVELADDGALPGRGFYRAVAP